MNKNHIFISILIVFLAISTFAYSQTPTTAQKNKASKYTQQYDQLLSLTQNQKQEIQTLVLKQVIYIDNQKKLTPTDAQWLTLNQEIISIKEQIKQLLSEEQRATLQESINRKFINKKTGKDLNQEQTSNTSNSNL
ncbi:hypothetical protein [Plebeiibacterium marinum]|uniref:LTXXQ motif family protein n=1 Tax=Plebeiibacterium marinum TaxID=2992111 RepID=A0AAE3SLQ6_9BACT|nr:hypothetical protein [Plebeiobacterium marinum]MCW3807937.1 hypothetical protein [Plebeiobacterium marinum]